MTWTKPRREAKQYEGPPITPRAQPLLRIETVAKLCVPLPKTPPIRDKAYLRRVAALPCAHCGRAGPSQAAHADSAGKGMGTKPSDLETMPLCADGPGRQGCHALIGSSGAFTREQRRVLERTYVKQTREILKADE